MNYERIGFTARTWSVRLFLLFTLLGSATVQRRGVAESKPALTASEGAPDIAWEQTGHSSRVNAVPFSPDGQLLASGGDDQNIKLWRAARCCAHSGYVLAARTVPPFRRTGKSWRWARQPCTRIYTSSASRTES